MEKDIISRSYEVIFEGGSKIDFDSKGTWEEIDCRASAVPEAAVPSEIMLFQLDSSRIPHGICSSNTP